MKFIRIENNKMMKLICIYTISALLILGSASCSFHTDEVNPISVLKNYFNALNQQDYDLIASSISDDVKWYLISSDTANLLGSGKENYIDYVNYVFSVSRNSVREIGDYESHGNRIIVKTIIRVPQHGSHPVSRSEIYEIKDGLIYRIWTYH